LKIDGQSWTAYAKQQRNGEWVTGICGRTLEYKLDSSNNYTRFKDVLPKLLDFAQTKQVSLAIRGEVFGVGVQSHKNNPHSVLPKAVKIFSVYLIDSREYAYKNSPFYFKLVCEELGLAPVDFLEENVVLTQN